MYLIAGSYEHFIWGYNFKPSSQTLTQLFSHHAHSAPITTVSAAGPAAASGGSDDSIHLYDLSSSASLGSLHHHHSATVTSLTFFTLPSLPSFPRNLISVAEDGTLCIHDADPFVMLKSVPVHKRPINDVAVHPSGKVALTVGRDECLGMVNLVRGRRSFYCRVGKVVELVEYSVGGEMFFMGSGETVGVHDSEDAREISVFKSGKRVNCFAPGANGLLFAGGEDGNITAWDTNSGKAAYCIEDAHSRRLKGIVAFNRNDGDTDDDPYMLASASSDGVIRVWDVRMAYKEKPTPLAEAFTNSRLTCLAGSSLKSSRQLQKGSNITEKEKEKERTKERKGDSNDN